MRDEWRGGSWESENQSEDERWPNRREEGWARWLISGTRKVTKSSSQADVETRGIELYGVVAMTNAHEPMEKKEEVQKSRSCWTLLGGRVGCGSSWAEGPKGPANLFL